MAQATGRAAANMVKMAARESGMFGQRVFAPKRDMPETYILFGCCVGAFGLAAYAAKRVLLNNTAGAYWDINLRGDPMKQSDEGRGAWEDRSRDKHSIFWHAAQYKMDDDGANIGILFDNRIRPHQYSRPGTAGVGSGISITQGL